MSYIKDNLIKIWGLITVFFLVFACACSKEQPEQEGDNAFATLTQVPTQQLVQPTWEPSPTLTPTLTPSPTPSPSPTPTLSILEKIEEFEKEEGNLQKILTSDAFLLVNMTQDDVLYSYRASEILYPASITKLMTAYLALEYGNLDDTVTISQTAVTPVIPSALMCGFRAGDQIKLRDLLTCMLLCSGNDTAVAVAEHISGSEEEFVALMNQTATELGMKDTVFCNAHGLPDDEHVTSAHNIYLIMEKLFRSDEFLDIIALSSYTAPYKSRYGTEKELTVVSTNFFLSGDFSTPDGVTMIGGKTGTTNKAGFCLCVYVMDTDGDCYIAEIFGSDTRPDLYKDMTLLLRIISDYN